MYLAGIYSNFTIGRELSDAYKDKGVWVEDGEIENLLGSTITYIFFCRRQCSYHTLSCKFGRFILIWGFICYSYHSNGLFSSLTDMSVACCISSLSSGFHVKEFDCTGRVPCVVYATCLHGSKGRVCA